MLRSSLFLAASALAISACQPAAESSDELVAETPPAPIEEIVEDVATEAETEIAAVTNEAEAVVEAVAAEVEETDHDHDEDHGEAHDHDHAEEDHDEHNHDDHDHEDHDHDHDDHDHAGGEAHVHGVSDLAASVDGATLSVNVEGALANFGVDESLRTLEDTAPYTTGTVSIIGGDCTEESASASIRPIGDHGNMVIDLTYSCAAPAEIEAIDVIGFQYFAGFEEVNAVFLTETGQTAETLTTSDTRLDLN